MPKRISQKIPGMDNTRDQASFSGVDIEQAKGDGSAFKAVRHFCASFLGLPGGVALEEDGRCVEGDGASQTKPICPAGTV
jgi:hypothetical protein